MVSFSFRSLRAFLAGFTLVLALLIPTSALAAGATIAADGNEPGIAVAANGTGHIAFRSSVGTYPAITYDYSYCRLPRGGTACAPRTRLTTPNNLNAFGRAQVFVDATRVIVVGDVCCGAGSGIYAWVSTNGGTTFAAPKLIASDIAISHAVQGPGPNEVSILTSVTTSGVNFVSGNLSGSPVGADFKIGAQDGLDAYAYSDVGMLNSTTPYVVMSDGTSVYLKLFDNTKIGTNNPASWKPAQRVDGSAGADVNNPTTASGPFGAFMIYQTGVYKNSGYPLDLRRINDDGSVGPVQEITPDGANPIQSDIATDSSGRVHVAYLDNHDDNRLKYVWSKRGVTFSDPINISDPDEDAGIGTQVGVASDGGGWIVEGSFNSNTPIRVFALAPKGDADPAPTPKTPTLAPGATPAPKTPTPPPPAPCPAQVEVAPGIKAMVRSGACFSNPDGKGKVFKTTGSVRVNGIDFTAPASGTFTVDTKAHTVAATGAYKVSAGAIVLASGSVTWNVTQPNTINDLAGFGVKLFGFSIVGKADVSFSAAGGAISINVQLPYPIDSVRGQTTLHTTMADGLITSDLHITASTIPIGPLEIRNLDVSYTGANDQLEGHADFFLPPGAKSAISAGFGFQGGDFTHAEMEAGPGVPGLPLPLWPTPPILLNRVGLSVSAVGGLTLGGGVELVVGGSIAGLSPVSIDALRSSGGGASIFIPKDGSYALLSASGKVRVLDIPIAYGGVSIDTRGPITVNAGADLDLYVLSMHVGIKGGFNLSNADFFAQAHGEIGVDFVDIAGKATVDGILSSLGFAVCGSIEAKEKISGVKVSISLGYDRKWGQSGNVGSCNIGAYVPASFGAGARASRLVIGPDGRGKLLQVPGGQTLTLGGGDLRGVRVQGAGSRPGFTFTGPGGRTITVPAGASQPVAGGNVAAVPVSPDTVELQVHAPAGSWTIAPAAGSTITSVKTADALPKPKVKASVRKTGKGRQLTVKASNLGTQQLVIRELLPGGVGHELGKVTSNGTKTIAFSPADAAAGKRVIQAVVLDGQRQVAAIPIGSYTAPGPAKLAAPRSVSLKRSASSVSVKWNKVTGADRYRVRIIASDGRIQVLTVPGKSSSTVVPGVTSDDNVQIKVSAVTKLGIEGKSKAATSKPLKKAKTKKTKKK